MYRLATLRELEVLLSARGGPDKQPAIRTSEPDFGAGPDAANPIEKSTKDQLVLELRSQMLTEACSEIVARLKSSAKYRSAMQASPAGAFSCKCLAENTSCEKCRQVCLHFAEGVMTVVERDMVQLVHGRHARVLENRPGIQFLLAGITLALLYESVLPKEGLDALVLEVCLTVMATEVWLRALLAYGPAPPRPVFATPTERSRRTSRSQSQSDQRPALMRPPPPPMPSAATRERWQELSGRRRLSSLESVASNDSAATAAATAAVRAAATAASVDAADAPVAQPSEAGAGPAPPRGTGAEQPGGLHPNARVHPHDHGRLRKILTAPPTVAPSSAHTPVSDVASDPLTASSIATAVAARALVCQFCHSTHAAKRKAVSAASASCVLVECDCGAVTIFYPELAKATDVISESTAPPPLKRANSI